MVVQLVRLSIRDLSGCQFGGCVALKLDKKQVNIITYIEIIK